MLDRNPDSRGGLRISALVLLLAAAAPLMLICMRWPIVLVGIAGMAGLGALLWAANYTRHHTQWLLLALLLNEAMSSVSLIDESIRPVLRYALLALFCLPVLPAAFRTGLLKQGGFKLYVVYFIWSAISVSYSLYPVYSLGRVMSAALLLAAIVVIISDAKEESDLYELIRVFWIGSSIIMIALAASLALPGDLTWTPDDSGMLRFTGLFNGPNQIGELMLTTVASGLVYWLAASKRTRVLIALSTAAALTFDALADSRSPFIALCAGLLVFAVSKYRMRAVVAAAAVLLVVFGLYRQMDTASDYVTRGDVTSLTGRTEIWKYVVHAIEERPLTGWGYEVEGELFQNHDFPLWEDVWDQGPRSSIHNGYLARAAGVGIPAALLWIFLIARALGYAVFDKSAAALLRNAVVIACIPVLILNMTESTAGDCRYSVGLLMGLIWALSERARLAHAAETSSLRQARIPGFGSLLRVPPQGGVEIKPRLESL
jgi:O-antigen ligase